MADPSLLVRKGSRIQNSRPRLSGAASRIAGFSLIEVLVTVGVILVLAALVSPGYKTFQARVVGTKCLSNLRQISIAAETWSGENNGMLIPVLTIDGVDTADTSSYWCHVLIPYLGDAGTTEASRNAFIKTVACPAIQVPSNDSWHWGYGMNWKPGMEGARGDNRDNTLTINASSVSSNQRTFQSGSITPKSKRLFLCDATEWQISPGPADAGHAVYDRHGKNRCNVLFFDGHVETLPPAAVIKAAFNPGS